MGTCLTGHHQTDILILANLDDYSLSQIYQCSKYTKFLCDFDDLWRIKVNGLISVNFQKYKSKELKLKDYYIQLKTAYKNPEQISVDQASLDGRIDLLEIFSKKLFPSIEVLSKSSQDVNLWLANKTPLCYRRIIPIFNETMFFLENGIKPQYIKITHLSFNNIHYEYIIKLPHSQQHYTTFLTINGMYLRAPILSPNRNVLENFIKFIVSRSNYYDHSEEMLKNIR